MVLHIFPHNFLNIQPIFNPEKVLEKWDLGQILYMLKVLKVAQNN